MLGELLSAGTKLIGGFMDRKAAEEARAENLAFSREQLKFNQDMAMHGIQWKVNDATAAGIHPLYALGAPTISPSAVSVGDSPSTSMGSAVADMGQDLSRAMTANQTQPERDSDYAKTIQALTTQKMGLENDILASKAAVARSAANPAPPPFDPSAVPQGKVEDRPPLAIGGGEWKTYPGATNAEDFEKRYGDIGEEIAGVGNFLQDSWFNLTQSQKWQMWQRFLAERRNDKTFAGRYQYNLDNIAGQQKRSRMGPN